VPADRGVASLQDLEEGESRGERLSANSTLPAQGVAEALSWPSSEVGMLVNVVLKDAVDSSRDFELALKELCPLLRCRRRAASDPMAPPTVLRQCPVLLGLAGIRAFLLCSSMARHMRDICSLAPSNTGETVVGDRGFLLPSAPSVVEQHVSDCRAFATSPSKNPAPSSGAPRASGL